MPKATHVSESVGASATPERTAEARRGIIATVGAIGAAFLASLCCIGPLLFVFLGVGAGLASTFEPLRPVFTAITIGLLGIGFYVVYGRKVSADGATCGPDGSCAVPRARRRDKVILWGATVAAIVLLSFPWWSLWFV